MRPWVGSDASTLLIFPPANIVMFPPPRVPIPWKKLGKFTHQVVDNASVSPLRLIEFHVPSGAISDLLESQFTGN
jgi:hypothetical protein